jgi:hypothetical protein
MVRLPSTHPGGKIVENDNPEDEPAGRGSQGGEDEFVFGLLLHAPIITCPLRIASMNPKKVWRVNPWHHST